MTSVLLSGGNLVLPGAHEFSEGSIRLDRGLVGSVGVVDREPADVVADVSGLVVAPGLIDLQVNGGWGDDLTLDPTRVWAIGERLASVGVTSWLPTLVSPSIEKMETALEVTEVGAPSDWPGATPLGWHFEGPWISPEMRGAHRASALHAPPMGLAQARRASMVTLAPELDGADDFIAVLSRAGVVVSVGHSAASCSQTRAAFDAGATMGTHLFNAMSGLHHREPGVAGALLDDERTSVGLIVDGLHVVPEMVKLVWAAAGDRVVLVSDAMAATCVGNNESSLGDQAVRIVEGSARLADGTLAGSLSTLRDGVANLTAFAGCHPARALRAACEAPAKALGDFGRGRLSPGAAGDLVVLSPALEVEATIISGRLVYSTPQFQERME
ncbi:MAG: N-acetylglucosamine-6-phosphate deacetylase [Actinomycetia bacterium]|nr:N-acetylglucosamine-6-phosphate deacetylase [Actinomycetes bacterium]